MTSTQISIAYGEAETIAHVYGITDIDDFRQDCIVHIYERIHKFDPARGKFKSWANRCCLNVAKDMWKAEKKRKASMERNGYGWEPSNEFCLDVENPSDLDPSTLAEIFEQHPEMREAYWDD